MSGRDINDMAREEGIDAVRALFDAGGVKPQASDQADSSGDGNVFQLRPKPATDAADKSGFPNKGKGGVLLNTVANARHAVKLMGIACSYDIFHDKLLVGGRAIGEYTGELSDHCCLVLRRLIEEEFAFDPGREKMFDACVQLCLEGRFDPVLDYLNGLSWDGVSRLDTWLTTYMSAADTPLSRAIGKIALVAMVRRARQPGCKFDQIITMESKEGYQKSTALAVLAGATENFSDQTILGRSDKEQQELLRGVWVYEIADLSNIGKAEVEHVKAFASRTHDRARPAYGRARIDMPRRCVIWATTNSSEYLKSQTGNRRFWPLKVGVIDIDALKRDRDQLLAEAAAADNAGASLVLPRELWADAGEQQEQRREVDPWEDVLRGLPASRLVTVVANEQKSSPPTFSASIWRSRRNGSTPNIYAAWLTACDSSGGTAQR